MEAKELRIGNKIETEDGIETVIAVGKDRDGDWCEVLDSNNEPMSRLIKDVKPIPLTEEWLGKLGFTAVENKMYVNGKQWLMQVTRDYGDEEEIINRDGTWFDGIGTHSFRKDGAMAVNVLCRGNYVCNTASTVHQLQNLYFALTGKELTIK